MRIFAWHVHGSWMTAFVHGPHDYLVPVTTARDADGLGRATTYRWPPQAREVSPAELRHSEVDLVVLQRPHELDLTAEWLGRRPGRDVPAVYVEHNTPAGHAPSTKHFLADQDAIPVVHVTHFNNLMWDSGRAPVLVVEHGIVDPGYRYSGEWPRAAVAVNEPRRRGRVSGLDLLPDFCAAAPVDVFGMGVTGLPDVLGLPAPSMWTYDDLAQPALHAEMAKRRVYIHPYRWTSLGLALIEAMHLGMPVVALATTEAVEAVPPEAGVISTRVDRLVEAVRRFVTDPHWARQAGKAARQAATGRYSLARFITDWDRVFKEVTR
jgi:glycosyltransferase involved in cell wall biosynthesis